MDVVGSHEDGSLSGFGPAVVVVCVCLHCLLVALARNLIFDHFDIKATFTKALHSKDNENELILAPALAGNFTSKDIYSSTG